ncbi:MAG: amidase family protein [Thermoleophilia bacterium]
MLDRMTPDDIRERSFQLNLGIREDEIDEYLALANTIIGVMDALDVSAGRTSTVDPGQPDVVRTIEHVTDEERARRDPLNAIVRFTRVKQVGASGPLAGKRVVVKDSFAVAGVPMTCGSRVLQGFVPTQDSTVAARLLAAGAEIVGMANMENMAFSGGGETSYYGPIGNPADPTRVSGGSSGGSAAALGYPWVDIGIGTDQGGSIRIPASFCGVLGFKPTHGLVPYSGGIGLDRTIDHVGPFSRDVKTMAETMAVVSGPDGDDPRQDAHDFSAVLPGLRAVADGSASLDLKGVRIGLPREAWGEAAGIDPRVDEQIRAAVGRFEALGAELVEVSTPWHARIGPAAFSMFVEGLLATVQGAGGLTWFGKMWPEAALALGRGLTTGATDLSANVKAALMVGTMLRERYFHVTYAEAMNQRRAAKAEIDAVLQTVDVLAMPTLSITAYPIDPSLGLNESIWRGWSMLPNTPIADMTGHPSLSLPTSKVDGLPCGTMLTGRTMGDHELLRLAAAYEAAHGWELGGAGQIG